MARPNSIADVNDRFNQIATFNLSDINTSPLLLKAYIAFIETAQKQHGIAKRNKWNSAQIEVSMPKDKDELEYQLQIEQANWDSNKRYYDKAINGDELEDYQFNAARSFAEKEFPEQKEFFDTEYEYRKAAKAQS